MIQPEHRGLLTPTELIVVVLYDTGWKPRQIARYLSINPATVREHLTNAATKVKAAAKQNGHPYPEAT